MGRYWTSRKSKDVVSERRAQLDLLFAFANADLSQAGNSYIPAQILDLLTATLLSSLGHPFISRVDDREALWKALQKHLCGRIRKIMHNTLLLVEMPLWKISGSLEFTVEAKVNRFHQRIRLRKSKTGNAFKVFRIAMDLALMNIFQDLDFKPNRIRQCPRCGIFFYQPTEKTKQYCSIRCGDATRLKQFRKPIGEEFAKEGG